MSNFRLQGRHFFLTYPKCDLDKDAAYDTLNRKESIKYAIVSQEKHLDGSDHLHAYIELLKKVNIKDPRFFDIAEWHPNVQRPRNIPATINYVKKDGNFKEFGIPNLEHQEEFNIYKLAKELPYEEYFNTCLKRKIPFQYANDAWKRSDAFTIGTSECEGKIRSDLSNLSYEEIKDNRKSIILIGPSGIGKTSWCKRECPKPALFVTHLDTLKQFNPKHHKCIIFDDMSFIHLPREAQIHLTDRDDDRAIHVRYGVAYIPRGTPKLFTANRDIFLDDEAINRRIIKHIFI